MPLTKATTNVVNLDKDTLINGLTVGKGGGNIATNTAIGAAALFSNTTGNFNTAIGANALQANTTGSTNVAIGSGSLSANTTASQNTAVGNEALKDNTIGASNTATGFRALQFNISGGSNVANGWGALNQNTTGYSNTAVGYVTLYSNTTGFQNTAIGVNSLSSNTTGVQNTAVGERALQLQITGSYNTGIGSAALYTSGTAISNATGLGNNAQVTGNNQVQLGDSVTTTYAYGAVQNRSDIRDKADVRDTELGLEFINALRPVDFKWDMREDYRPEAPAPVIKPADLKEDATEEEKAKYAQELAAYNAYKVELDKWLEDVKLANITHDGSKKRNRFHHGLIAQEVKAALDAKGIDFGGFQDHSVKGGDDVLSIGYIELIAPLIKAVQELSAKVAKLEAK